MLRFSFSISYRIETKGFLWADDLSSFDEIIKLAVPIPVYGDHVSLFQFYYSIAIFFLHENDFWRSSRNVATTTRRRMPDMTKIMKMMIYISPIMMLLFFNNYGSGLSLYNFISNLITIGIMLVIKNTL